MAREYLRPIAYRLRTQDKITHRPFFRSHIANGETSLCGRTLIGYTVVREANVPTCPICRKMAKSA